MADNSGSTPHGSKKTIIHVTKLEASLKKALRSGKQYGDSAGEAIQEQVLSSSSLWILADVANTTPKMVPFSTVVAGKSKVPICSTPKKPMPKSITFDEVSDDELSKIVLPSDEEVELLNEQNNLRNNMQGQENLKFSEEVPIQIGQKKFVLPASTPTELDINDQLKPPMVSTEGGEPIRYHADPNTDEQNLDDSEIVLASIGKPKLPSIPEEKEDGVVCDTDEAAGSEDTDTAGETEEEKWNS